MMQAERTFQARSVVVSSVLKKLVELWRPLELIPCHALYMHPTLKTNISLKRLPYWGPVFIGHLFGATQDHHLLNDYKGICFGAYAFFVLNIYIYILYMLVSFAIYCLPKKFPTAKLHILKGMCTDWAAISCSKEILNGPSSFPKSIHLGLYI